MRRLSRGLARTLGLLLGLLAAGLAGAQDWPARALRLVVPIAAGGTPDVVARGLAQELGRRLGQPVVVENRPGAQTNIGMEAVARAAPDGYTFLLSVTSQAINPHLQKLAFDPLRDLAPVALISRTQFVLMSGNALPAATLPELIAHARARPAGLTCAHAGGVTEIACALLGALARVKVVPVAYRGSSAASADVARGEVDIEFYNLGMAAQEFRAGQMRAYAVTDPALGSDPLPPLPRLSDALPGFEVASWQGIVAPAGTPARVVQRMNAEVRAALAAPDVARLLLGGRAGSLTAEEFGEFLRLETARYGRILRETGLRPG